MKRKQRICHWGYCVHLNLIFKNRSVIHLKQQSPNTGIYNALIDQLDKVARHNRQGSFRTKERYYEAMKRFCRFLAEYFRIKKLSNINAKHLNAYIIKMQEDGKSASTIKTDLAAIRFFHDKMSQTKYRLPSNDELSVQLERRRFTGIDRTWTQEEFHRMLTSRNSPYRPQHRL